MAIDSELGIGIFHTDPMIGETLAAAFSDEGYDAAVFQETRGSLLISELVDSLGSKRFKVAIVEIPFPYDRNTLLGNFAAKACAGSGVKMIALSSSERQVMENDPTFPVINTPYRLDELINLVNETVNAQQSELVAV